MIKALIVSFLLLIFLLSGFNNLVFAEDNQFIVIVNPVRISSYTKDPVESLKSEYEIINKKSLPATWLVTFDVLDNSKMVGLIKMMNTKQEQGIFLEVTPNFARNAEVVYHNTGFWHHAEGVFLSGYTQEERQLLIDKVFTKFKEVFGYYPSSVGSWGTDGYSLSYIKDKYEITANLVCSDQFATDGYQIWGQPWQVPYYPSKYYSAVFASDLSAKLDVVNLQWAARDPLNGYYNSLFSTQDYLTTDKNLNTDYFEKLVRLYTDQSKNGFGQITVGLEADFSPDDYKKEFAKQMNLISSLRDKEGFNTLTMKDFSGWYREKYPDLSPPSYFETSDLLGGGTKAIWSQSPKYRIFYTIDAESKEITVRDLRFYGANLEDPYYYSPNRSFNLTLNIPSIVDEISFSESIKRFEPDTDNIIEKFTKEKFNPPLGGVLTKGLSSEAIHFFRQKKAILLLLIGRGWNHFKKVNYLIPQGEVYALNFLRSLPKGKVLVYDHECLQCEYHTKFKPPSLANIRGYVQKYGRHAVVYNKSIISNSAHNEPFYQPKIREEIKNELVSTKVKYIYLVKFESYFEKLPFSPGDLGVEKIFSNANAEIWRVVK